MHRLHIFSGMQRRVSVVKDIPVVNRFQGVVSFFFCWCVSGHVDLRQRGKAKGDPLLFLFFLFAFHLLSLPRAAVWSQPLESSREKKRRVSLLSSASHLFDIQTPRSGSEQSVTGRTGLSPFHPCLYLHVSHSLFHYLFGGSSLVCTVN